MTQEAVLARPVEPAVEEVNEALTVCRSCDHLVPKTNVCLYCGAPILFKVHKTSEQ
jgi:rRNA maturation endonuclease Nob1